MKAAISSLILLIAIVTGNAWSQTATCLTGDPTTTVIDTIRTTINLVPPEEQRKGKTGTTIALEVLVLRSSDGQIQYSIMPNSFRFEGEPAAVDAIGTRELFRLAEQATIAQGVMAGYTECGADCRAVTVKVCQTACVRRTGHGLATRFEPCDPTACCVRTYQVCCPDGPGAPVTRLLSIEGARCGGTGGSGGDCESVCW